MSGYKTEQDKMSDKTIYWILFGSIFGTILGASFGYYLPDLMLSLTFIGSIFLNGLKVIIIPLIITSIVVGITSMGDIGKLSRTAVNTLFYFFSTTIIAVLIGTALVMIFEPGIGVERAGTFIPQIIQDLRASDSMNIIESIIPSNIPQAIINGNYLGIIIVTIIFSLALTTISRQGKVILDFFTAANEIIFKLINILLIATPVGLFVLVGSIVAENNQTIFFMTNSLGSLLLVVLAGFVIHGFLVLPLILRFFAHQSPVGNFKNLIPAMATAFGSGSSTASLAITYDCVVTHCKVDKRASSFVLPLGSTINVDGTAMYAVIAAFFIAQVFGVSLTITQMLLMASSAIFLSFGLTNLPHATLFLVLILLDIGDYPPEAYAGLGFLMITDWFFDRLRAGLNVWSDAVGAIIIGETFEFKTSSRVAKSRTVRKDKRLDSKKYSPATKPKAKKSEPNKKVSAKDSKLKKEKKVDNKIKVREFGSAKRSKPVDKNEKAGSPFDLKTPTNSFSEYDEKPSKPTKPSKPVKSVKQAKPVKSEKPKIKQPKPTVKIKPMPKPEVEKSEKVIIALPKPPKNLPFPIRVEKTDKPEIEKIDKIKKFSNKEVLPVATVVKELSKVAERLAALEKNDLKETSSDSEDISIEPTIDFVDEKDIDMTPEETKTDEKVEIAKTEKILETEKLVAAVETVSNAKPVVETAEKIEPPKEEKPEKVIQFGRTSKKSTPKKEPKPKPKKTEPEKLEKTDYNLEKQSFGRSPKKKIRK